MKDHSKNTQKHMGNTLNKSATSSNSSDAHSLVPSTKDNRELISAPSANINNKTKKDIVTTQSLNTKNTFPQQSNPSRISIHRLSWASIKAALQVPLWRSKHIWFIIITLVVANITLLTWMNAFPVTQSANDTRLFVDVKEFSVGNPIFAVNQNQEIVTLYDEVETTIESGTWTLVAQVDGVGGLYKEIQISPNKTHSFSLELQNSAQISEQISSLLASSNSEDGLNSASLISASYVADPIVGLSEQLSSDTLTLVNNSQDSPIPLFNSLATEQLTDPNIAPQLRDERPQRFVTRVAYPGSQYSYSISSAVNSESMPIAYFVSTNNSAIVSPDEDLYLSYSSNSEDASINSRTLLQLTQDCNVNMAQFNASGTRLRYFKTCATTNQNGYFSFDIMNQTETLLLQTSDLDNIYRIALHPERDEILFYTTQNVVGTVIDGRITTIQGNSQLSAPVFSPDGQFVYMIDAVTEGEISDSLSLYYGVSGFTIRMARWDDITTKQSAVVFQSVGHTYYIPRPANHLFAFWNFVEATSLQVGDSPIIYTINADGSLTPTVAADDLNSTSENQVGRQYAGSQGTIYYTTPYLTQGDTLLSDSVRTIYVVNGQPFFLSGERIYRESNGILIQAIPERVVHAQVHIPTNSLQIINERGEIQFYQLDKG